MKDTIVIAVIVVLNAVVGFVQEYRAEQAMAALKEMSTATAQVVRDGETSTCRRAELVPGDLVRARRPATSSPLTSDWSTSAACASTRPR